MSSPFDLRYKSYPSSGQCVFCLKFFKAEDLTNEHIIPKFLSGKMILVDGSCKTCARRSNKYYEESASQTSFLFHRLLLTLDRRRKGPKILLPAAMGNALDLDSNAFSIPMTLENRPAIFSLIDFPHSGISTNKNLYNHNKFNFKVINLSEYSINYSTSYRVYKKYIGRNILRCRIYINSPNFDITVQDDHDIQSYLLTIAKIGYCFAVAERGIDSFDGSAIRDLLRGKRRDIANFVGSPAKPGNLPETRYLHSIYLEEKNGILFSKVQLFSHKSQEPLEVSLGLMKKSGNHLELGNIFPFNTKPLINTSLLSNNVERLKYLIELLDEKDDKIAKEMAEIVSHMTFTKPPKIFCLIEEYNSYRGIWDSRWPTHRKNLANEISLVMPVVGNNGGRLISPLCLGHIRKKIDVTSWLNQTVIDDKFGNIFSRKNIIELLLKPDPEYSGKNIHPALKPFRHLKMEVVKEGKITEIPFDSIKILSMKQIAYEIIYSLDKYYYKEPNLFEGDLVILWHEVVMEPGRKMAHRGHHKAVGPTELAKRVEIKAGRISNPYEGYDLCGPCPCGNSLTYRECCREVREVGVEELDDFRRNHRMGIYDERTVFQQNAKNNSHLSHPLAPGFETYDIEGNLIDRIT